MKAKLFFISALAVLMLWGSALFALDLKFTSNISISPASPTAGNTVTFTISFKPEGGAVTNFKIIGGVDTAQVYERTFASIPVNVTRTVSFDWTSTAGNHTAWFELDPDHLMGDADYTNNRVELVFSADSSSVFFKPPFDTTSELFLKPDLVISDVKFTKNPINDEQYSVIIKFKNIGSGCIGSFRFKMYGINPETGENLCVSCLEGNYSGPDPLCMLKAGEEKQGTGVVHKSNFSKSIKKECPGAGLIQLYKYYNKVHITADYDNQVYELTKTNNQSEPYTLKWKSQCP
jgi:hypothetical protein